MMNQALTALVHEHLHVVEGTTVILLTNGSSYNPIGISIDALRSVLPKLETNRIDLTPEESDALVGILKGLGNAYRRAGAVTGVRTRTFADTKRKRSLGYLAFSQAYYLGIDIKQIHVEED
jgi:hypothetical protein